MKTQKYKEYFSVFKTSTFEEALKIADEILTMDEFLYKEAGQVMIKALMAVPDNETADLHDARVKIFKYEDRKYKELKHVYEEQLHFVKALERYCEQFPNNTSRFKKFVDKELYLYERESVKYFTRLKTYTRV